MGRPLLEAVAFAGGDVVDSFCLAMLDIRGGRGCDTLLAVPIRVDDMLVIADWMEAVGEDAYVVRSSLSWSGAMGSPREVSP